MKKKIISIILIMILLFPANVFASEKPIISFSTDTNSSNSIYISVNIKNIKNLYAASFDFTYDPKEVKVREIEGGDMIKDKDNLIELGGETEKNGNRASYQFTFSGKVNGVSGSGEICKILLDPINNKPVKMDSSNMKIKLAGINSSYKINEISYKMNGTSVKYEDDKKEEVAQDSSDLQDEEKDDKKEEIVPIVGSISEDNSSIKEEEKKNDKWFNSLFNKEDSESKAESNSTSNGNSNSDSSDTVKKDSEVSQEIPKNENTNSENKWVNTDTTIKSDEEVNSIKRSGNIYVFVGIISIAIITVIYFILEKKKQ